MTNHPQQDVCCLMGDPIAGNPTQYMLEKAIEAGRLDWRFLTFEIPALEFEGALRGARIFGFHGIMLAPPHDAIVIPYLEEVSDAARLSGQVNCIHQISGRLCGENTQGRALRHLVQQSVELSGAQITILGDGPSVRCLAAELAYAGVREIILVCRQSEAIEDFMNQLVEQTPLVNARCEVVDAEVQLALGSECRLLVNTQSDGDDSQPQQILPDLSSLSHETVVADLLYNPPETTLLQQARERGCTTIDGLMLLIEQTALAFETWTNASADRQAMREAVEEFLVL